MGGVCSACSDTDPADKRVKRDAKSPMIPENRGAGQPTDYEGSASREGSRSEGGTTDTDLSKFESLFEDLARFLKTLPTKSKKHIWAHGVKVRNAEGKKVVVEQTTNKDQITRLLCDCVIVYIKYLDRKKKPLSTKDVMPHVEPAAQWIFDKYSYLERTKFEDDKEYFAKFLEDYQIFVK